MAINRNVSVTRRGFVRNAGALTAAAAGGSLSLSAAAATPPAAWPRRILGKTQLSVTCMTLGTAPSGLARSISAQGVAKLVNEAIDLGINFIDTSPKYGNAEEGVGQALGRRRADILLATKVWADTIQDAQRSLANSLKMLRTDYVDVLYFHHLGDRDVQRARQPEGVFTWLLKQKRAGKCRFVGISGHNRPGRFPDFLQSGDVDVILVACNFVDRHTYGFEEKVLPVARQHNVGVVAMKVFGAPDPKTGSWFNPEAKPNVGVQRVELAIRYALSLSAVATLNLGVHTSEQLRQNVELVKRFRPLSADEQAQLSQLGRELSAQWGPHFGPVDETTTPPREAEG